MLTIVFLNCILVNLPKLHLYNRDLNKFYCSLSQECCSSGYKKIKLAETFVLQFDRWSDAQRKTVLEILLSKCKNSQLQYTFSLIDDKIPITHVDFTRKLPRVITVYMMSFLDPRSLCRCAQVCWFWKYLSELDQIWMPKCFKFGWILPFVPTPFEQGVWKRHYLECVRGLQYIRPKVRSVGMVS